MPGLMPHTQSVREAPQWASPPPMPAGTIDDDARALARYAAHGEDVLATLPARPERNAAQQALAERVFTALRGTRRRFLDAHAEAVYDDVTHGRSRWIRLSELMYVTAERFPGLVPSRDQMDAELAYPQADKDGREIDQGILCGALLRSPVTGSHLIEAMQRPTRRALELREEFSVSGRIHLATVVIERRETAAHVTFHNAHCLNAEDNQLVADLETAVDLVLLDEQVRVGVLRGGAVDHPRYHGRRVFSAGINLKDLRNGAISFVDFLLSRELGALSKMVRGLVMDPAAGAGSDRTVQKPWVGAVDTFAIGGGMQLLLVMDRVIADDAAYLSLPAAEEGIVPGLANLRLTRVAGARLARQVILAGRRIQMTEPEAWLLCDEIVPAGEMDAAIERAVRALAAPAVIANRRMLNLSEEPVDLFREYLAEFAVTQVERAYSADVLTKVERRWQRSQARGER